MRTSKLALRLLDRIERAEALDAPAGALNAAVGKVIKSGPVEDVLSGVPLGHPLHPAIVSLPIGAWGSALALDAAGQPEAARRLVGFGLITALPATASGASDWLTLSGAERRVGFVHAVLNYVAIGSFAASYLARSRSHGMGVALSGVGSALLGVAGWLGGHLTYAQGVGVDTTVFQSLPDDWTDAGAIDDLPAAGTLGRLDVDGVPLLVTRRADDVVAMADRCSHRGAPLDEGEIKGDCVICPWHGSAFDLADGSVRSGPASRPQPVLETRTENGRLQVRRTDVTTLRAKTVGP